MPVPGPASEAGLRIEFAVDHPLSLSSSTLTRVVATVQNTTDRSVEMHRLHETFDIYLVRDDGAPVTMSGGDAMIIREPIIVGPHQTMTVGASVQLEPCSGAVEPPPPGEYGAVLCTSGEGPRSLICSDPVPATIVE